MTIVSLAQKYPGHAAQVLALCAQVPGGAYFGKWIIAVDEDVNPTDMDQVIWAMWRSHPGRGARMFGPGFRSERNRRFLHLLANQLLGTGGRGLPAAYPAKRPGAGGLALLLQGEVVTAKIPVWTMSLLDFKRLH
jgi:hypothetical protein